MYADHRISHILYKIYKTKKKRLTRESTVQRKQPHNILQPETPKGMSHGNHTQTNGGQTH